MFDTIQFSVRFCFRFKFILRITSFDTSLSHNRSFCHVSAVVTVWPWTKNRALIAALPLRRFLWMNIEFLFCEHAKSFSFPDYFRVSVTRRGPLVFQRSVLLALVLSHSLSHVALEQHKHFTLMCHHSVFTSCRCFTPVFCCHFHFRPHFIGYKTTYLFYFYFYWSCTIGFW